MIHCCLCLVRIIFMDLALSLRWFCERALLFIFAQKNDSGMLLLSNPAVVVQSFKTSIFFLDA